MNHAFDSKIDRETTWSHKQSDVISYAGGEVVHLDTFSSLEQAKQEVKKLVHVLHGGMTVDLLKSSHLLHLKIVLTCRFTVMQEVGPGLYHRTHYPHPTGLTVSLYQYPTYLYWS